MGTNPPITAEGKVNSATSKLAIQVCVLSTRSHLSHRGVERIVHLLLSIFLLVSTSGYAYLGHNEVSYARKTIVAT